MEVKLLHRLSACLENETPVALVTIVATSGSAPGKPGALMVVERDGTITGTVGGGGFEHKIIAEAQSSIDSGLNKEVSYDLSTDKDLGMICGGTVRAFIKVFSRAPKLIIAGAGHIGLELYKIGILQGFKVIVFDTREELNSAARFPLAQRIVTEDCAAALKQQPLHQDCYVTIATSNHELDRDCLEAVVESDAAYIGMIGSSSKIRKIFKYLLDRGVPRKTLEQVFAPMGLNIASIHPREIALAILSEVLLVKNNGSAESMCKVKSNLLPK